MNRKDFLRSLGFITAGAAVIGGEQNLKAAADQVYTYPMKESAKNALGKMLQKRLPADDVIQTVLELQRENDLCIVPEDDDHAPHTARIICSMGLSSEN